MNTELLTLIKAARILIADGKERPLVRDSEVVGYKVADDKFLDLEKAVDKITIDMVLNLQEGC